MEIKPCPACNGPEIEIVAIGHQRGRETDWQAVCGMCGMAGPHETDPSCPRWNSLPRRQTPWVDAPDGEGEWWIYDRSRVSGTYRVLANRGQLQMFDVALEMWRPVSAQNRSTWQWQRAIVPEPPEEG